MSTPEDWLQKLQCGAMSRREFIERAAVGGLSFAATASALAQQRSRSEPAEAPHGSIARNTDPDQTNRDPYEEWLRQEGIPVYRDYAVADLRTLELAPWKRLGARGAHLDLKGGEGVNDCYVCEIAPARSTTPQRYLFEEVIYVLSGTGETAIWLPGGAKQTVKWQAGSVLGPPLNTWRQHFNHGNGPARFLVVTNAPVVIDLFHNADFVFNNDFVFRDRYNGDADIFGTEQSKLRLKHTKSSEIKGGVYTWLGAFVPNARDIGLKTVTERGAGNSRIELQLADNTMQAHISEFAVGTYKKAHRHGPGSHVVMLNGRGYTLMWKGALKYSDASANQKVRIDFAEASVFVPPDGWFHQHFNTGPDPARYLAATWGGDGRWFMEALGGGGRTHRLGKTSTRLGGNLIEYEDEDPVVREIFEAELKKAGIPMKMQAAQNNK